MHCLVVWPELCLKTDIHQLNTLYDLKDDLRHILFPLGLSIVARRTKTVRVSYLYYRFGLDNGA